MSKTSLILQLKKEHPEWRTSQIAKESKVKRQTAWEVLKQNNFSTIGFRSCIVCLTNKAKKDSKFCSKKCKRKHISFIVHCGICGKEKYYQKKKFIKRYLSGQFKHFYCSWEHFQLSKIKEFASINKI